MKDDHLNELRQAKYTLENPGLAARISNTLGSPLEKGLALLPAEVNRTIVTITTKSLEAALDVAVSTMNSTVNGNKRSPTNRLHKATVALTGAAGGAFGLPALALELPISTTIMLRSIADIARGEGEDIRSREAQLACLEVFAFGGPKASDDAVESAYFGTRVGLAKTISDAARHLATQGAVGKGSPALVRLISELAARFSLPVSQKVAAQAVPLIGASGGALVNTLFIDHFQDMARGHFTVRRLERQYDPQLVREIYISLPSKP